MRSMIAALCICLFCGSVTAQCPNCPGPACPSPNRADPYGISYATAFAKASQGQTVIIVVGLPDRFVGTFQWHARVERLPGYAPGEYVTSRINGKPYLSLNVPAQMSGCKCCKPTCTCKPPGSVNADCECYPCKCNR